MYPDEGSQLLKAMSGMNFSWVDVSKTLNTEHQVGCENFPCPVSGHNFHGRVERAIREIKRVFDQTFIPKIKLDIMGYETAFSFVSNQLNNLPFCLGRDYSDLGNLDLIIPNRLIMGRANKRALAGPCTVDNPSKMLQAMSEIHDAWWKAWADHTLTDFVSSPPKWYRSSPNIKIGDIIIFQKTKSEICLGQPIWTIGRVIVAEPSSKDGKVRDVVIEYSNASEWRKGNKPSRPFRTTRRAARSVAILHSEDDLELMCKLAEASRQATCEMLRRRGSAETVQNSDSCSDPAISACLANYAEICSFSKRDCPFADQSGSLCHTLKIHTDPWL
jgi:hypothetical protein